MTNPSSSLAATHVDGLQTFHTVTGRNLQGLKQQRTVSADDVRAQNTGFSFIKAINHSTTCHTSELRCF